MKLSELFCQTENINIDKYLEFYNYVRDNMEHKEWLGTFTKEEIIDILNNKGKIYIYHLDDEIVCSFMYMPVVEKTLEKHHINFNASLVGACGPIMVNPKYVGHGLQGQMLEVLDGYCQDNGNKYIFTKVHKDNIYSINNFIKKDYKYIETYIAKDNEPRNIYLKAIK